MAFVVYALQVGINSRAFSIGLIGIFTQTNVLALGIIPVVLGRTDDKHIRTSDKQPCVSAFAG